MFLRKNLLLLLSIMIISGTVLFVLFFLREKDTDTSKTKENDVSSQTEIQNQAQRFLSNPASSYCLEQGGKLQGEIAGDSVETTCLFSDGSQCDAAAFYEGTCQKGE